MKLKAYTSSAALVLFAGICSQITVTGQDAPTKLDAMVVTAESEADQTEQTGWLPSVSGASIFSGKKTAVIDLDALPRIVGNNYRQALSQTPGLLLAEESTPLVSLGYRGLNPHRAQFTQVLRDGIPIHADQLGYPEAYYTPPLDTVDRIEFLHGGAALQYGPQPGGALNYITHRPRTDKPFSTRTQHVVGSDDLYSTFSSADGTVDKLGYYVYFNHRESDGFRSANSDYELNNGAVKLLYSLDNGGRIIFNADTYEEDHGEPGGLTRANFESGSLLATRQFDRFSLARDSVSLTYEIEPNADSFFTTSIWWSDYQRKSFREDGGGFGIAAPVGSPFKIEDQRFESLGLDSRYRMNWGTNAQHTFSTGFQVYHMDSPRTDAITNSPIVGKTDRETFYLPVFAENKFTFGKFSITPGIRLENIWQDVVKQGSAARKEDTSHVLLGGLGAEYAVNENSAIYGNVSQSYRPATFTEAVPSDVLGDVPNDLEEGKSIEYELGFRSRMNECLTLDASLFLLSFTDQIGKIGTTTANLGDSIHKGMDVSVTTDLLALMGGSKDYGSLDWYVNGTLLDAEFTSGPTDGETPQYAPDYILRSGLTYAFEEKFKVSLGSTFLGQHFANDTNDAPFKIPSYMVWDLTAEYKVHENVRLVAGINNLFDESYFSRVRNDGIDPANGRNFYIGASFEF